MKKNYWMYYWKRILVHKSLERDGAAICLFWQKHAEFSKLSQYIWMHMCIQTHTCTHKLYLPWNESRHWEKKHPRSLVSGTLLKDSLSWSQTDLTIVSDLRNLTLTTLQHSQDCPIFTPYLGQRCLERHCAYLDLAEVQDSPHLNKSVGRAQESNKHARNYMEGGTSLIIWFHAKLL